MNSRQAGSSDFVRKPKKEIKKRGWTSQEEEVLLSSLKALVADGWKSDNGFRGGYMNHLEDTMRKAFPGTDITAKPHIESKLTAWKRTYSALRDLLGNSGVGFNLKGDNKIDCDNVLWAELTKGDSNMRNWRTKSWPYLEDWKLVFGKDRANGEGAHELDDMVNNLMEQDGEPSQRGAGKRTHPINVDESQPRTAQTAEDSVGQSRLDSEKRRKTNKRRHFEDSLSSLVDLVGNIQSTNVAKYEHFTSTFGKKVEVPKCTRSEMWPLLKRIEGLTLNAMFDVGEKLLKMPECMELFLGLEEEARPAYVERIMNM